MSETVTMSDVGKKAGVTKATVSYVLNSNSKASISKETRKKVLQIAKEMGYKHNLLATSLRMNKSHVVGLLVPSYIGFYAPVVAGVEGVLKENDYLSYLLNINDEAEASRAIELYLQRRLDGLLLFGPTSHTDESYLARLDEKHIPFVVLLWEFKDKRISTVGFDEQKCGEIVTEHLISLGHKQIVYLTGTGDWNVQKAQQYKGYRRALEQAGIAFESEMVVECGWSADNGYQGTRDLLKSGKVPTGLFCFSDLLAYGALKALSEAGIRVPQEVSVVGVDDRDFSEYTNPPLTTLRTHGQKIGCEGAKLFMKMLDGDSPVVPTQLLLEPELIVRQSSGPCPDKA